METEFIVVDKSLRNQPRMSKWAKIKAKLLEGNDVFVPAPEDIKVRNAMHQAFRNDPAHILHRNRRNVNGDQGTVFWLEVAP